MYTIDQAIEKLLDLAARMERLANKNNCPEGVGPRRAASENLALALEAESLIRQGKKNEAREKLSSFFGAISVQ